MEDFNSVVFGKEPQINPLKAEEKKKIRKTSNLIGAAYIAMNLVSVILNSFVSDIIIFIGPSAEVLAFINNPTVVMVLNIVFSMVMFTLPFLILPVGIGKKTSELAALRKPQGGLFTAFVFIGVGISAFGNIVSNQIGAMFEMVGVHFTSPDFSFPSGIFGMILSFLGIAVTPALVEEFANRGMVLGAARQHGLFFGLIVSSAFFSLMHGNLVQIPFAFVMGIVIGYAAIKTGSIITGMVIHFLNNAISVSMSYGMASVESVTVQSMISLAYIGICTLLLVIGIFLAQAKDKNIWHLEKSESLLTDREKLKVFVLSPTVIISIIMTIAECAETIIIR